MGGSDTATVTHSWYLGTLSELCDLTSLSESCNVLRVVFANLQAHAFAA
jgi:hypothetical protein